MRTIFIGVFILALLAGIMAKTMDSSKTSFFGYFLNIIGLKKQQQAQTKEVDQIVSQFKADKDQIARYLEDQQRYLENSRLKTGSLTEMVRDMTDRADGVDLLRLKGVLRDFEDQSILMIENGDKLLRMQENHRKISQKMAAKLEIVSNISNNDRTRFLENFRNSFDQQQALISGQLEESKTLRDRMKRIQDQVAAVNQHTPAQQVAKIKEKLRSISDETATRMANLKQKQERLKMINQNDLGNIESIKQKIEDLKRSRDSAGGSRERLEDQTRRLNDRMRDQLERTKDRMR